MKNALGAEEMTQGTKALAVQARGTECESPGLT